MAQAFKRVGVAGAGLMGGEIAFVAALAGHSVVMTDRSQERVAAALARLAGIFEKGAARGVYDRGARDGVFARLETSLDLQVFASCDFVIEAVFEQEEVKAELLRALDGVCAPACVIATNTSTIPISVLASYVAAARRPSVIGTHYFSPVSRMKLVEVIPGIETASETVAAATSFLESLGKTPVLIKDVPGFAVNRLLHVFLIEAVRLVEEGVATPEDIDKACRLGLGHPMGPFELMDATTSSLCLQAQEIMFAAYGERFRPRPLMKQRVRAGYGGGKGKPGWRSAR